LPRRLRRAGALETRLLNGRSDSEGAGVLANVFPWDSDREKIQLLSRYEVTLERSLYRALHELQRLQAAREGRAVPLPAAVDVDVSVSGPGEASFSLGSVLVVERGAGKILRTTP
jgi:hypothetical protein